MVASASAPLATFSENEIITLPDLREYVSSRLDMGGAFKNSYAVESSLNAMILTRLLVLEGEERSIPRLDSAIKDNRYDDKYAVSIFRSLSVSCDPLRNEQEEKDFYKNNPEIFRQNAMARLFRYMLPKDQKVEGIDAQSQMMDWAKAWSAGKITLDQMGADAAKIYNFDVQGDIGWLQLSNDVELMRAIASAKVGELVGPVVEGDFVYLFYVAGKNEERQLPWDDVKNQVAKMAISACARKNSQDIKKSLYDKYRVKINTENIKNIFRKNN